jgi:hypothetical protein
MALSSLSVVSNSLLLKRWKPSSKLMTELNRIEYNLFIRYPYLLDYSVCCWTTKALYNNRPAHNTGPMVNSMADDIPDRENQMSNQHFSGRCLCGAIQFKVAAKPLREVNCHCVTVAVLQEAPMGAGCCPEEALTVNGEKLREAIAIPVTAEVRWKSSLYKVWLPNSSPAQRSSRDDGGFRIGVIDDASWFKPTVNVYRSRALPSTPLMNEINSFEKMSG